MKFTPLAADSTDGIDSSSSSRECRRIPRKIRNLCLLLFNFNVIQLTLCYVKFCWKEVASLGAYSYLHKPFNRKLARCSFWLPNQSQKSYFPPTQTSGQFVCCQWLYTIKYNFDRSVKLHLVPHILYLNLKLFLTTMKVFFCLLHSFPCAFLCHRSR